MTDLTFDAIHHLSLPTRPGFQQRWLNLHGSAQAWALVEAARQHSAPIMVVCADTSSAQALTEELRFFSEQTDLGEPTLSSEGTESSDAPPNQTPLPILSLPDWEVLPYDHFSPHQDIVSERLTTLRQLPEQKRGLLVVPVSTLMQRLAPVHFVATHSLALDIEQKLDAQQLRHHLEQAGYRHVTTVMEHGEYAIRGGLIDLYPMGEAHPIRIELFDDEVESLRLFDPETQRTTEKVSRIRLLPAHEFPMTQDALAHFREEFQTRFDIDPRHAPIYQDTMAGIVSPGLEFYLPLFFEQTARLTDYLPDHTLIAEVGPVAEAAEHYWAEVERRYENLRHDPRHPCLPPQTLYLPLDQLNSARNQFARLIIPTATPDDALSGDIQFATDSLPDLAIAPRAQDPLGRLTQFMASHPAQHLLICAESTGRREALLELFSRHQIKVEQVSGWQTFLRQSPRLGLTVAPLDRGLMSEAPAVTLITESALFGERVMQRRRRQHSDHQQELVFRSLSELVEGAPVVHAEHGVGRYHGLETLSAGGETQEFLKLIYADSASLYVPVSALDQISRYSGTSDELAPLHRLGSDQWSKARRKAAEKIRDTAAELLDIYARREAEQGYAFELDDTEYERFASSFPFEETPDQELAIEAVIHDLTRKQPMDRVVCGDVGFGKTEVALRAAFVAAQNGKQVAVLVPTTLLAQQHYDNFRDRFADWPIEVEVMSRFRSTKEQNSALERLEEGKIDIIIGTHKLLQSGVNFHDLGLVIVDEEHRFGVRHKEKLKALRANVDLLAMTATPIPRTLNMAMSGIRDLSIIATPPARRLSVKTFVRERDSALIKEAILRELLRGGQVYFLHNDVKTIDNMAEKLAEWVPEARIGVAHGQMPERQLEKVMSDFYHKRFNVLLCSTIIETGIDVPSANTMIIERADKFGLAQLHQLRGRVGRSHHQAYAYLLTPGKKSLTADAEKRLEAIAMAEDLGAGFALASQDLEIRGAGELLGEEQSGQIETIGFTLYMDMLDEAVEAIRQGKTPSLDQPLKRGVEINLHLPALIPDDYMPDVNMRLTLYKRIASADSSTALKELQVEMIDRFGLLPEAVKHLFRVSQIKLDAQKLGIIKLDAGQDRGLLEFGEQPNVDAFKLVQMVQQHPDRYRLNGASAMRFYADMASHEQRMKHVEQLLETLAT